MIYGQPAQTSYSPMQFLQGSQMGLGRPFQPLQPQMPQPQMPMQGQPTGPMGSPFAAQAPQMPQMGGLPGQQMLHPALQAQIQQMGGGLGGLQRPQFGGFGRPQMGIQPMTRASAYSFR